MADDKEKMQDEKQQGEKGKGDGKKEKKSGDNKILLFSIIGGVVVINVLVAFLLIQLLKPPNVEKENARMRADSLKQVMGVQTSIGTISDPPIEVVVNIAGTDGMRFLKVVLVLEYDEKQFKALGEELALRHAKFKSLLIEQLSAMTIDEVKESDVQIRICKEFMRTVNSTLPEKSGEISNVYLNEFIIQ